MAGRHHSVFRASASAFSFALALPKGGFTLLFSGFVASVLLGIGMLGTVRDFIHKAPAIFERSLPMFHQIITHTPIWVWAIFMFLAWLGFRQSLPSSPGFLRITLLPLAMLGLSLVGTVSNFAKFGSAGTSLLVWGCAFVLSAMSIVHLPLAKTTCYNARTQRFELPGSWAPLGLMMGIFVTKYAMGIAAAMRLDVMHSAAVSYGACALFGSFSGVFSGRALRLWRLMWSYTERSANPNGA